MTIKQLKNLFIFLLVMSSLTSFAIDDFIVNIEQVSTSGKTIYVDSGFVSKVVDNDYGVLVKKIETTPKEFIFKPVAKLRVVKVYSDHSIWVAYKVFLPEEVRAGNKLFLFSETAFLQGRKEKMSMKRTKLITNKGTTQEVKDFLLEGDSLARNNNKYMVVAKPLEKEVHYEKEIDLVDVDQWEQRMESGKLYAHGIYRSPYAKEFSDRKKVHTFEKMVVAFLRKYNDPNYSYDEFYAEQKRMDGNTDDFQDRSNYLNTMDRYEKRIKNKHKNPLLLIFKNNQFI